MTLIGVRRAVFLKLREALHPWRSRTSGCVFQVSRASSGFSAAALVASGSGGRWRSLSFLGEEQRGVDFIFEALAFQNRDVVVPSHGESVNFLGIPNLPSQMIGYRRRQVVEKAISKQF